MTLLERLREQYQAFEPKSYPDEAYFELADASYRALPALLTLADAAQHIATRGILGKQSRRRLREALRPLTTADSPESAPKAGPNA